MVLENMNLETKKLQSDMAKTLALIDRTHLRPLQREMYLCSAKCCEDSNRTTEEVNNCLEKCAVVFQQSYDYTIQQFEQIQQRMQRCVQDCNDEARDALTENSTQAEVDKATDMFQQCAVQCIRKVAFTSATITNKVADFVNKRKA